MTIDNYIRFLPGIDPVKSQQPDDIWIIVHDKVVLVKKEITGHRLVNGLDYKALRPFLTNELYVGTLDNKQCFVAETLSPDISNPEFEFVRLRTLLIDVDEETYFVCSRAIQLLEWKKLHKFCGGCGATTIMKHNERAMICTSCDQVYYPRISPAVIVAIVKDGALLLARKKDSVLDFYSVLAGFVEPGESFEQCAKREILEEVQLRVKNLNYFGSQPWPFPNSLMVAFTAEYASGEIKVDGVELDEGGWFKANELPKIPLPGTISRKLIDWFVSNYPC